MQISHEFIIYANKFIIIQFAEVRITCPFSYFNANFSGKSQVLYVSLITDIVFFSTFATKVAKTTSCNCTYRFLFTQFRLLRSCYSTPSISRRK